jgi:hypothetical protein
MPFLPVLFFVFLVLKLTHYIDWSWWIVTSPLWGGAILFLLATGGMFALTSRFSRKGGRR